MTKTKKTKKETHLEKAMAYGINFHYGTLYRRGVILIIGDSIHGELIPKNYIQFRVNEINENNTHHLTLNHNIKHGGFTALPKACLTKL